MKNIKYGQYIGVPNTRTILWYLIFIGSMLQYMIRITINITITEMVLKISRNNLSSNFTAECFNNSQDTMSILNSTASTVRTTNSSGFSFERSTLSVFDVRHCLVK